MASQEQGHHRGRDAKYEALVWSGYPSWWQFLWLYFFALLTGLRALLFFRFGIPGWPLWIVGSLLLLLCAAILRRWGHYLVSRSRLVIRNGYTGRDIHSLPLGEVGDVTVRRGPIAQLFDIGTIIVSDRGGEEVLRFRGIAEPEVLMRRINALRPAVDETRQDASRAL